jgi:phosphomannomutase
MIYTAVCGAGYVTVIKYFIKMGVIDNVDINIYSDDDRHPNFYKPLVRELKPWVNDINLFYNEKSKDFGIPKKDIKIVKKRIS